MFETKKTLIVVYKDELLMNQLKKLIETHDDHDSELIGTKDDSINVVSWTEKVWLGNKKAGNIQGKILFLGDIKGSDKLIPVIDLQCDEYGVKYGWAGNQGILYADWKALTSRKDYDAFLEKLSELPVPDFLKGTKESVVNNPTDEVLNSSELPQEEIEVSTSDNEEDTTRKAFIFNKVKKAFSSGADAVSKFGTEISSKSEEVFRNKSLMQRQMLFYGVIHLYNYGLEKFMNM